MMTNLYADTAIGVEVARLTKTAMLSEQSVAPRPGGTHIHTDEYARQRGFESALVPGVTLLGYLTEMLTNLFGEAWFERGSVNVRFRRPVYDNEEVVTKAIVKDRREENGTTFLILDLSLETASSGNVAVVGEAVVPIDQSGEVSS